MNRYLENVTLPTVQYDDLLVNYEAQLVLDNVIFDGGNSKYSVGAATTARQALIDDHTWTITDGGQAFGFVSTWDTTNAGSASDTIILPMTAGSLVDWGDGTIDNLNTHTYSVGGVKTVKIDGAVTGWRFGTMGDEQKILTVENAGGLVLDNSVMFSGCSNMTSFTATAPLTTTTTTFSQMFLQNSSLISINGAQFFDFSSVTDMVSFCQSCPVLVTLDLSTADFTSLTTLNSAFFAASSLTNVGSSNWQIPALTNMSNTFFSVTLDTTEYSNTLINFESQLVQDNVVFTGGNSKYSAGAAATARQALIDDHTWTITDGGQV